MEDPSQAVNVFLPPIGSVFDTCSGRDGPPMMRMFIIQGAFESVKNFKRCTNKGKMLIVLIVSMCFIMGDMKNFISQRSPNIYAQIGVTREADFGEIDQKQFLYNACIEFEPECDDKGKKGPIYKLNPQDVKDIFTVLKNPARREVYDKTEMFIRTRDAKKMPTEGARYMSAFGETSSYSIFVIMTLMLV